MQTVGNQSLGHSQALIDRNAGGGIPVGERSIYAHWNPVVQALAVAEQHANGLNDLLAEKPTNVMNI